MSVEKQQIQLPLSDAKRRPRPAAPAVSSPERLVPDRLSGMDQVLSTHDIERITGRHRCTIYRWILDGSFPKKRAPGGKGWLRSDVEKWLRQGLRSESGPLDGPSTFGDRS